MRGPRGFARVRIHAPGEVCAFEGLHQALPRRLSDVGGRGHGPHLHGGLRPDHDGRGWTLEQSLEVGVVGGLHKDRLGIYKQGTTCALAFSGTDDVQDITNDLNPEAGDICGMGRVHLGFFRELVQMTQEPGFQSTLVPYLANQCTTVFAVGHSLGGAVASLFSSIVNNGYNCPLIPSTLSPGFTIAKLYTVGAPAVSKDQITDANGACFGGKRIFNEDNGILNPVDPVARVMQKINFLHPMIEPVRMREWRRYRPTKGCCRKWRWVYYYEKFTSNCDGAAAQRDPNGLTSWASSLHLETAYVTRAKNIFR